MQAQPFLCAIVLSNCKTVDYGGKSLQDKLDSCLNPQRDWVTEESISQGIGRKSFRWFIAYKILHNYGADQKAHRKLAQMEKGESWSLNHPCEPYYGEILGVLTSDYSHHTWMPFYSVTTTQTVELRGKEGEGSFSLWVKRWRLSQKPSRICPHVPLIFQNTPTTEIALDFVLVSNLSSFR